MDKIIETVANVANAIHKEYNIGYKEAFLMIIKSGLIEALESDFEMVAETANETWVKNIYDFSKKL